MMLILNHDEIKAISGASKGTYTEFNVELNSIPIENLPIINQLAQACIANKWEVTQFTQELTNAGIDPGVVKISAYFEFDNSFYGFS